MGSALEPYKVEPDRQVFLIDVDETSVARYEYELQDGAPVFTAVRVFGGSAREVGYGPDEAGPPSPGGLTATALAKVTPGAHLSALYRELRERAEEAERERARGPRLSELAGKPPFPPDYTTIPAIALFYAEEYGLSTDELARPHRRRSRTGADRRDVRYARVAYLYSEKVRAGSRRVAEEIAEQLGGDYDAKRVRHMISHARHKRFLTVAPSRARASVRRLRTASGLASWCHAPGCLRSAGALCFGHGHPTPRSINRQGTCFTGPRAHILSSMVALPSTFRDDSKASTHDEPSR